MLRCFQQFPQEREYQTTSETKSTDDIIQGCRHLVKWRILWIKQKELNDEPTKELTKLREYVIWLDMI